MKVYLASPTDQVLTEFGQRCPDAKMNALLTFAAMPTNIDRFFKRHEKVLGSVALDSGAFSLNNAKSIWPMSASALFRQFAPYADADKNRYELIFNFDEGFTPDSFEINDARLRHLEAFGVSAVPVIHSLANDEIQKYIDRGYSTIAIGKCSGKRTASRLFPQVFRLYNAGVDVHLLGITDFALISRCPASSCDSKSWVDDSSRGIVKFWNETKTSYDKTDRIYFPKYYGKTEKASATYYKRYKSLDLFEEYLNSRLGYTIDDMIGRRELTTRAVASMLYYVELEAIASDMHIKNRILL